MSAAPGAPVRVRAVLGGGAVLVAVAIAAVYWMTGTGPAAPEPGARAGDAAPAASVPVPGAALAVPASAQDAAAAPPGPPAQAWKDVPVAARLSDLGSTLARPVYDGLRNARTAMEPCFQADEKERAAHPRAADADAWGAAILTLQIEARPGELVIVNAPLQELGTSSPSLVDCCEGVLRGFRIPAAAAVPGKRYRLQHQLVQ